ncbi:hypothetical protein L1987_57590 [Smallanthus sonchifolius]|uniref:Uncharacterized protein n=1 Tax=Smallanthus sonchifolius TaxID=185202 RepID=A0ACB9DDY0_9ASTR|nr:hypothetical protein L1987_57590 [Smallanthus sonchifolius]
MKKKDDDMDDDKEGEDEKEDKEGEECEEEEGDNDKEGDDDMDDDKDDDMDDDDKEGDKEGHNEEDDHEVLAKTDNTVGNQEVEEVCKGNEEGEDEVKETIVEQNVEDDQEVEGKLGEQNVVENEVVANKVNEEVDDDVMEEHIVENIVDDEVHNEGGVKEATDTEEYKGGVANDQVNESDVEKAGTNNEEHEDKKEGGDDEQEHPLVTDIRFDDLDQEEETLIYCRTWLMEHAGYKQEEIQDWGLKKLEEEMTRVESEIAKYDNMRLEGIKTTDKEAKAAGKKKRKCAILQTEVPTKKLEKEDINQEKRIKTLSQALKSPYVNRKVAMGEKISKIEALVTNYIFQATDVDR